MYLSQASSCRCSSCDVLEDRSRSKSLYCLRLRFRSFFRAWFHPTTLPYCTQTYPSPPQQTLPALSLSLPITFYSTTPPSALIFNNTSNATISLPYLTPIEISIGSVSSWHASGPQFDPHIRHRYSFLETWSWKNFYGHSPFSADSRRAVVSYWRKNVRYVLVNCLEGLPRNNVVRVTDRVWNDLKCVKGLYNRNQNLLKLGPSLRFSDTLNNP